MARGQGLVEGYSSPVGGRQIDCGRGGIGTMAQAFYRVLTGFAGTQAYFTAQAGHLNPLCIGQVVGGLSALLS
jgi:hypothetical protein